MEAYELAYCEAVGAYLEAEAARLRAESALLKAEMREAGRQFAAENPYGALYQSAYSVATEAGEHVAEMEKKLARAEHSLAEAAYLEKLRQSPYFGRVDFSEDGQAAEAYYIGLRTLFRGEDSRILTYDWRAPVPGGCAPSSAPSSGIRTGPSGRILPKAWRCSAPPGAAKPAWACTGWRGCCTRPARINARRTC